MSRDYMIIPASNRSRALQVLILDDDPERVYHFERQLDGAVLTHAPSALAAQSHLGQKSFDVCFLDHDLELSAKYFNIHNHGDGRDVTNWLAEQGPEQWKESLFIVHSLNQSRGREMVNTLRGAGFTATRRAYAWNDIRDMQSLVRDWEWPVELERWDTSYPPMRAAVYCDHPTLGGGW